jgi:hypothetical protein
MAGDGREGGYIKLHRRIKSWPLWQHMTALQRQVVIEILLSANWKARDTWSGPVDRGELAQSEETIAHEAKVSRKVVRQAIALLEAEGFLTRRQVGIDLGNDRAEVGIEKGPRRGRKPSVLSVVKYEKYQGQDEEEGPKSGQPRASRGPSEGQPRAPLEEGEEREAGNGAAPLGAPLRLELAGGPPESLTPPAPVAVGAGPTGSAPAKANGKPKSPPDPLRRALSDALVAAGREERNGCFAFDGEKDGPALTRLLSWSRDVADHTRRFRLALCSPAVEYGYHVDTIAAFATGRVWNHFAPTKPPGQPMMQRLGAAHGGN